MKVPDNIRKCVGFIGYRNQNTQVFQPCGTLFFLAKEIKNSDKNFQYAVTAKHVIDGLIKLGLKNAIIRLNLGSGGIQEYNISLESWFFHPEENIDVAAVAGPIPEECDHLALDVNWAKTPLELLEMNVGGGTEVFLAGLFEKHYGKERNIPIVRIGSIAAMPEEEIESQFGLINGYLVELKSFGGLSGSPVFINLGTIRSNNGKIETSVCPEGVFYLIGLMQGHWDEVTMNSDSKSAIKNNMGIGIVVSIDKVLEVINQPKIIALEEESKKQLGL
jgi:hypothetical protein